MDDFNTEMHLNDFLNKNIQPAQAPASQPQFDVENNFGTKQFGRYEEETKGQNPKEVSEFKSSEHIGSNHIYNDFAISGNQP